MVLTMDSKISQLVRTYTQAAKGTLLECQITGSVTKWLGTITIGIEQFTEKGSLNNEDIKKYLEKPSQDVAEDILDSIVYLNTGSLPIKRRDRG